MYKSITSVICSFMLIASLTDVAHSEDSPTNKRPLIRWNVEFETVPKILRMHCPTPKSVDGLLVKQLGNDFRGPVQLRHGDVVLFAGGTPVSSIDDLPQQMPADLVVMRRGQVMPLTASPATRGWNQIKPTLRNPNRGLGTLPCMTFPGGAGMPFPAQQGGGVSASSYAGNNESVSVSQNGNQISIDMSLPSLHAEKLQFRGTLSQIEQEVNRSNLPAAAKQRVLDAVR